jgi:hypothetical protein
MGNEVMQQSIEALGRENVWLQTEEGWILAAIPIDTPAEKFGDFEKFVRLWREKSPTDLLPAWEDFELHDFESWYGWYAVFDIEHRDPIRLKCRLWGTGLVKLHDRDMTNQYRELGQHGYDQHDDDFAKALIDEQFIGYDEGQIYWEGREFIRLRFLTFPLASDGVSIDKILHLHLPPFEK